VYIFSSLFPFLSRFVLFCFYFCFFFSSRRRHTRSKRDWSSDVCSSDLSALRSIIPARFPLRRDRQPPPVRRRAGDGNPLRRGWGGQVREPGPPSNQLRARRRRSRSSSILIPSLCLRG